MPRARAGRGWVTLLPTVLVSILFLSAGKAEPPIAVIAHEQVPVESLSLSDLRQIFLGERQFWSRFDPITLLTPPRGSRERKVFLHICGQRNDSQYKKYWINKLFDDGAHAAPKITDSHKMSASLVRTIPGAIALVPANRIPPGVKVLRIDGKQPGEAGYPLVPPG